MAGFVSFAEVAYANELFVAKGFWEFFTANAFTSPGRRYGSEVMVMEAKPFGPDTCSKRLS